ncbi:helix-turn-helix transcriptional regulator [Streptomyces sp. AC563]|uniref:helix-turn-helix domain-containing protein n=1 Tax=Streptomyces buecherae TaxID=2763006 RepID=UPI00164E5D3C|nr:helix-turn-helix transcriptional regulator [Streptomyces buecherae]MBC3989629.1 helix-turn-helix transcriptional regulator [Streptomyces buecherae]
MTQRRAEHGSRKTDDEDDVLEWVDQVMATVAAEVRRRRKELGWSAQVLADRCEEIGHPIPRNVIANMESGRRSNLPLVDVMVLAEALNTPPICLVYPVGYVDDVQRLPLQDPTSPLDALRWFTGEETDLGTDDDMLRYFRAHHAAQERLRRARRDEEYARYHAETAPNADRRAEALRSQARAAEAADEAESRLRKIRAFIRQEGVTPPFLWPDIEAAIESPETDPDTIEENDL